jgi:hypothetical protein
MNPSDFDRQSKPFPGFSEISHLIIEPLRQLHGRAFSQAALGVIQGLRPSRLRVIRPGQGAHLDACAWRVTVHLRDGSVIDRIEQEVIVGLPEGIENGDELERVVVGDD